MAFFRLIHLLKFYQLGSHCFLTWLLASNGRRCVRLTVSVSLPENQKSGILPSSGHLLLPSSVISSPGSILKPHPPDMPLTTTLLPYPIPAFPLQQQCHTLFSRYPSSGDRNGNRVMGNHWAACQVKRQQVVSPPILFHSHPFVITHPLSFYHP